MLRKRDKPLRTYGRRSTATPEPRGEPPAKRSRVDTNEPYFKSPQPTMTHSTRAESTEKATSTEQEETQEPETVPSQPRATILSYFKPIETRHDKASMVRKQDMETEQNAPSKSPIPTRTRRGPRLLRIRAASNPADDGIEDMQHASGDEVSPEQSNKRQGTLKEGGDNLLNQRRLRSSHSGKLATSKRLSRVQTTLNISSKAAFEECKVCDTVWNPLYPDDVKFHTKRHARMLRAKRKLEEQSL